ncbi:hypothetical protein [Cetobacterium sp.]|uniref:hypothetical protein n=1 Tax=Cetobacterium sp. TaxID=2071632 RepID=UPI002FC955DC
MNTTTAKILKILFQSEITIDEMYLYLDIEKSAIVKSINQINEFLESIGLNKIEKEDNNYRLSLEKEEWEYLYSKYDVLTFEDKVDYLYVKFIAKGFINLEKEKEILGVSRSTILRCFQAIRDDFYKNGTEYEYVHGKGLKLKNISVSDKIKFCKKVIKLFIEEDILITPLKNIFDDLKKFDTKSRIIKLYMILKKANISINYFTLSFLCAVEVYLDVFKKFEMGGQKYRDSDCWNEIAKIVEEFGEDFEEQYKNQITSYIVIYLNEGESLENTLKNKAHKIIDELITELNISKIEENLKKMLFYRIYISLFKYENNILKIKKITPIKDQEILMGVLNKVLNKNSYELYYSDKVSLTQILRKIIIDDNLNSVKSILLLFNEGTLSDQAVFRKNLKKTVPHINFEMEATYLHKKNIIPKSKNYDLIISDEKISSDVLVLEYFSSLKIQELIEKKIFEIGLSKI